MDCIIPAAGASRRMGAPKQISILNGRPLLTIGVENALAVCSRCIVVTGANRDVAQSAIPARPEVEEVYNAHHTRGMISSIAVGANRVRSAWFFVAPGDMPRLSSTIFATLMDAAKEYNAERGPAALFPIHQGRQGHPVLIARRIIPDLLRSVEEYRSMRDFLRRYETVDIAVGDAGIFLDVDTTGDLHSAEDAGGKRDE